MRHRAGAVSRLRRPTASAGGLTGEGGCPCFSGRRHGRRTLRSHSARVLSPSLRPSPPDVAPPNPPVPGGLSTTQPCSRAPSLGGLGPTR